MPRSRCAFCHHDNPAGSKFCNECGSPLHLKPCAHCDAVNDDGARACYRCGAAWPEQTADEAGAGALESSAPVTHVPEAFGETLSETARTGPAIDGDSGTPADAETAASDLAPAASLVVPPDEARLIAARNVAAARRRRQTRTALAALLIFAATAIVYYEYFAANPLGDWLRTLHADVLGAIRPRAPQPSDASDEAARAREPTQAPSLPSSEAGEAAPATPASSATASPPVDNAASPAPLSPTPVTQSQDPAPSAPEALRPDASEQPPR